MEQEAYIVPGRSCGSCTACCKDLAILEEGLKKVPGVDCQHCIQGKGCGIYETRGTTCRTYNCMWRSLPNLDDSWRPDLSGILINHEEAPDGNQNGLAANLILISSAEILRESRFASMAAGFIQSGTATFLVVPQGPGMMAYSVYLNELFAHPIALRDLAEVQAIVWECYQTMMAQPLVAVSDELMTGEAMPRA